MQECKKQRLHKKGALLNMKNKEHNTEGVIAELTVQQPGSFCKHWCYKTNWFWIECSCFSFMSCDDQSQSALQSILHQFFDSSLDSQSSPSYSPVPWVAQVDSMCHCGDEAHLTVRMGSFASQQGPQFNSERGKIFVLFKLLTVLLRRPCKPSLSASSLTVKALGRSCLLANTSKTASLSSSS